MQTVDPLCFFPPLSIDVFSQLQPERRRRRRGGGGGGQVCVFRRVCQNTGVSVSGCKQPTLICVFLLFIMKYSRQLQGGHIHRRFFFFFFFFFRDFQSPGPFYLPSADTTKSLFPPFCWLKITPLQPNNEARFLLWGLHLTCMMGIVGSEGFQLLSVSVTDKQGGGTMGRRPLASARLSCCQTDSRCLG